MFEVTNETVYNQRVTEHLKPTPGDIWWAGDEAAMGMPRAPRCGFLISIRNAILVK